MSHFTSWKVSQVSKSLTPYDNVRVPHERKEEDLPAHQPLPDGQTRPRGEGVQIAKDTADDEATREDPPLGKTEPGKDAKDWKLPIPLGPVYPPLISSLSTTKAVGRSWDLTPLMAKSLRIPDVPVACVPPQGPFWRSVDTKAEKRLAGRKERRSRFGDVNVHKRYQRGKIFSPFQALATTEMRTLSFPQDLPTNPHVQRMGIPRPADGNRHVLSLSSTEPGARKDDNNPAKEKAASHIKMPLFPPIVKATKSNDTK
ncbi:uncharacterized protein LOC123603976 isoform X1 [Leopardus geoffroyi]|uniref:uncharacterized protein LOC123603976 isoform X1 n=1 Tax=Leopardus geoffroyi TaxID=46844 RepID=UPI001E26199B|nr:uncharacterized protein LOC123603976 isoform X1 [Leopardus geoffroyi]